MTEKQINILKEQTKVREFIIKNKDISYSNFLKLINYEFNFYDRTLSGVLTIDGIKCYYSSREEWSKGFDLSEFEEPSFNLDIFMGIYYLNEEKLKEAEERIEDFKKYVNPNPYYVDGKKIRGGILHPQSEHHKCYDKWKNNPFKVDEDVNYIGTFVFMD